MERFSASRLRAAREAAGVSREVAAIAIGRSYESIAAYELSRATPPADVISRLASLYGLEVGDLFEQAEAVHA